GFALGGGGVG
uniref:Sperm-activating peptide (Ala-3, Gly-5 SAP-I) n=2 Tax=Echinidea TaxID=7675 RepID=Q7M4B6_MESNU|nr:sperm-activating peptide I (3-Ala,5-Gly) [Mesocentrotus nudus]